MNTGRFKARAVSAKMTKSSQKNADQVEVIFAVEGEQLMWTGHFTEKTEARTLESLMLCGWDGQDFVTFNGITQNEVSVTVEVDDYSGGFRIGWVNDPNRTVGGKPMEAPEVASFAERMRAKVAALKASKGQPSGMPGTQFDFGANQPKARI